MSESNGTGWKTVTRDDFPKWTKYDRSDWMEAAATPAGARMVLLPSTTPEFSVSSGPLLGSSSSSYTYTVQNEIARDFRKRPEQLEELYRRAAEANPVAALGSGNLFVQPKGPEIMAEAMRDVNAKDPQQMSGFVRDWAAQGNQWGVPKISRQFVAMASQEAPEAVLENAAVLLDAKVARGNVSIPGDVKFYPVDEYQKAVTDAVRNLAARDPEQLARFQNRPELRAAFEEAGITPRNEPPAPELAAVAVDTKDTSAPRARATVGAERPSTAPVSLSKDEIIEAQTMLKEQGYDIGRTGADGIAGKRTEAAIRQFEQDHGLKVDGKFDPAMLAALESAKAQGITGEGISGGQDVGKGSVAVVGGGQSQAQENVR